MMDDRNDDLGTWLHEKIEPLPPPPGTFKLIKRRARRRRYRRLAVSAATAAAVIAAIAVIPQAAPSVLRIVQNPPGTGSLEGHSTSRPQSGGGRTFRQASTPAPQGTSPGQGSGSPPAVPSDFAATSATFIGLKTGWVIGQAGVPGHCATQYCTSVARTDNKGHSWYGVPAPLAGPPDGSSGVSQIRFLNRSDGWAFGPELFATHDGGRHWTRIPAGGMRVISLETARGRAFALFARCSGTGPDFAAGCTSVSLYSAAAGSNDWAPVAGPVTGLGDGGQDTSAALVLTATRGYLLAPDGTLYAGSVTGGSWQQADASPGTPGSPGAAGSSQAPAGTSPGAGSSPGSQGSTAPCTPGQAQPGGQPSGALLAAANPSDLALVCAGATGGNGGAPVFTSSDGGATWQQRGTAPAGGTDTSLAAEPGGTVVLATSQGIDVSSDGGATWQQAGQGPQGGFGYVGMTSAEQGVAVPADASVHAIWFTFNGGQSWTRSAIKSP